MNLLVFGASGGTGRHVVAQALTRGAHVTAFVRTADRLQPAPNLDIVTGDVGDAAAVNASIASQDVVISTLGNGKPFHPDPVVRAGIEHIVRTMEARNVRRLIYLSFIGVADSRRDAGPMIRYVARWPLRHEIADHEIKERTVRASTLEWTIVRPPKFTDGPHTGHYRTGESIVAAQFFPQLSRADVAAFIVDEALSPVYQRRAVRILPPGEYHPEKND